jgi:hypothetical protein
MKSVLRGRAPRATLALAIFVASLAVPSTALASPGTAYGFAGQYTAIDCATWWEENPDGSHDVECSIWGDGSTLTLQIGRGAKPRVVFIESSSTWCVDSGFEAVFKGVGYGTFDDPTNLAVTLPSTWCGSVPLDGTASFGLYRDPGSKTLWWDADGDGWGTVWFPVE